MRTVPFDFVLDALFYVEQGVGLTSGPDSKRVQSFPVAGLPLDYLGFSRGLRLCYQAHFGGDFTLIPQVEVHEEMGCSQRSSTRSIGGR